MRLCKDSERSEERLYNCAHLLTLPAAKAIIPAMGATEGKIKDIGLRLVGQGSYGLLRTLPRREEVPDTDVPPTHLSTEGPPRELSQCHWFYPFPTPGTAPSGAAVTFLARSNLSPQLGKDECRWQWCYLLYPEIERLLL